MSRMRRFKNIGNSVTHACPLLFFMNALKNMGLRSERPECVDQNFDCTGHGLCRFMERHYPNYKDEWYGF